jgi:alpha-glucosidase
LNWLPSDGGVLAFSRDDRFVCVTNTSRDAIALRPYAEILLASADIVDGRLPSDATAWIRPLPTAPATDGGG